MASQNGVPFLQRREFVSAMAELARVFPVVSTYVVAVPTYFGGHMTLGWASEGRAAMDVTPAELRKRFDAAGIATRYYTPEVHVAAFAHPVWVNQAAAGAAGKP
jgi:spermidine synthase